MHRLTSIRPVPGEVSPRKLLGRVLIGLVVATGLVAASAPAASAAALSGHAGAYGNVSITGVDNSGWSRSLTLSQTICKDRTVNGRLVEYRLNFGPTTRTDWKGGVSRWVTAGCSQASRSDTFYFPNTARGVWARICIDRPGPWNRCGADVYISV